MRHSRGRWAGKPFDPRDWQRQFITDMFALRPDGRRARREGLLGVARKAGKTTLTAGLALGLMVLENEPGGLTVCAAAKKDQAKLLLTEARNMVAGSSIGGKKLKDFLEPKRDGIYYPELDCWLRVVTADAEMEQGLNPNVVIIDELHVVQRDLYEALKTAQGAWENPLLLSITTAGARKSGVCWDRYKAGVDGDGDGSRFLMRWFEADERYDIDDPRGWAQANPGYPEVPAEEFLRDQLPPELSEGSFLRYHLNRWTNQLERWLKAENWDATAVAPEIPDGAPVVITVDAALKRDTFAVVTGWVDQGGNPHAQLRTFAGKTNTDGRIDFGDVETHILAESVRYQVQKVGGDPAFMTMLAQRLQDRGLLWEPYPQSDEKMLVASEILQRVVNDRTLRRGDDPVWDEQMAGTAVRETDRGVRISKSKSGGVNDAIIALAMNVALLLQPGEAPKQHFAVWA